VNLVKDRLEEKMMVAGFNVLPALAGSLVRESLKSMSIKRCAESCDVIMVSPLVAGRRGA